MGGGGTKPSKEKTTRKRNLRKSKSIKPN